MARCDQCSHWGEEDATASWDVSPSGLRWCRAVRPRWEILDDASGDLDRFNDSDACYKSMTNALVEAKAFVQDGSEYHAELVTGPDFFCALFDEK